MYLQSLITAVVLLSSLKEVVLLSSGNHTDTVVLVERNWMSGHRGYDIINKKLLR